MKDTEKMDAVDKAIDIGFRCLLATLDTMDVKLDDKQKEKLKMTYATAYLMTTSSML